jgi:hypothetical protein
MIEEVPEKRLNRRTRGERNKRRERYFLFNESYDYDTESDDLSDDMSPPSTPPANNNFFKDGEKSSGEGKPKTVRELPSLDSYVATSVNSSADDTDARCDGWNT